jgi:curved DNA-binding protein CbpA
MKTLYDLLGARPHDDAEGLRNAFRKAAKANHPDLHAGDPGASVRFREIVEAYDILRDVEQRAAYDRLLKFERERFRRKLKRTASDLMHTIVSDAVAVVGLAIVLGGGYTLFAYISKTPIEAAKQIEATGQGPARVAAAQPVPRTDTTRDKLERTAPETPFVLSAIASPANDGGAPSASKGRPIPSSVGLNADVAKHNDVLGAPVHQADAKIAADHPGRDYGAKPLEQDKAQAVEVRFSSPEKENGKLLSPSFAMSDDKHDMKLPDTPNANAGNVRIPEMKVPPRVRTVAKRTSRTFAQASLESRTAPACSGSCSGDTPPLFGVGF